ncbi:hypothetical protein YK48G_18940 [Lentilactobacillus fungorum]|uniref:GP-PDE domain-containing protein n=1 Tax=Lentilactobacillus fungorum TaxID=2201250 RepID=A0ABQ3W4R2_9LACO|nr:glycerophosphodiester phosphodiesterase family protein [Lentilactobacillus fungorum]GHP14469.1 hypothetical protein YK48G_18940 [Lentilactobacillus fungorum]
MLKKRLGFRIFHRLSYWLMVSTSLLVMGFVSYQPAFADGTATATQTAKTNLPSVADILKQTNQNNPLIFSHRGSPSTSPEHSFDGYDEAIKDGTKFIEQDVWLSKDGQLYVSHDDNLERTTGDSINISDSTSSQLDQVKLLNGEKLHTLDEVFQHYGRNIHYIIETKKDTNDWSTNTEQALSDKLRQYHMEDNVIIQDVDLFGLKKIHSLDGDANIPLLWLVPGTDDTSYESQINLAPNYITFLSFNVAKVSPAVINLAHSHGFLTDVYTLDGYTDNYDAFNKLHVDSAFTNNTAFTKKYLSNNLSSGSQDSANQTSTDSTTTASSSVSSAASSTTK